MTSPMSTLDEVETWLRTLSPEQTVSIGPAMFESASVETLFGLLSWSDPRPVTVIRVDAAGAALTGSADLLDATGCTLDFVFGEDADADMLLLTLTVAMPETVVWWLIPDFKFGFGDLVGIFAPIDGMTAIALTFDCTLQFENLAIPMALSVPSARKTQWTLVSTEGRQALSSAALTALFGNCDPLSLLPSDGSFDGNFLFEDFQMALDGLNGSCELLRIGMSYDKQWEFFDGAFTVGDLTFRFSAYAPFTASARYQGEVSATMTIGATDITVGLQYPDNAVFAYLPDGSYLIINDVFSFFKVKLPKGFPNIVISQLSFNFMVSELGFDFLIGISQPFELIGGVSLDNFSFNIGVDYAHTVYNGSGALTSRFLIGDGAAPGQIMLSGSYVSDGPLVLNGVGANLKIGDLIVTLAGAFGIPSDAIPRPIQDLVLDVLTIDVSVGGGADRFAFTCTGHTVIADVRVEFIPLITATHVPAAGTTPAHWAATFAGTVNIASGSDTLTFTVTYATDPGQNALGASYSSSAPLEFTQIAAAFGFAMPPLPPELQLGLTQAGFIYDFDSGELGFGMESAYYGHGACSFVSLMLSQSRDYVLLMGTSPGIDLTDLPLIGAELARIETVSIDTIQVAISSRATTSADDAAAINGVIDRLQGPHAYPKAPVAGMNGDLVITADFVIGAGAPVPLVLSMGGSSSVPSSETGARNAASTTAPTPPATVAPGGQTGGDGVVWFDVQKNCGPVTLQKVGLKYADSKLWALFNADLSGGGVRLGLSGLGMGSPLETFEPSFTISGIDVQVTEGRISAVGGLTGTLDPVNFYGVLSLATADLTIGALGGYTEVGGHPSFFLYAVLDYPIGGPPYFFVTGLSVGLGFNRSLVLPDIDGVPTFPLVQWAQGIGAPTANPGGDMANQVSKALTILADEGVVAPAVGQYWMAAGVAFTTFGLVRSFALANVRFGSDFEVDLLGVSTLAVPPTDPQVVIQLALKASFQPEAGFFGITGQLTPASHILSRDARLTGGFAYYTWFSGEHEGEFVITAGGYSPKFSPPAHYPQVARLKLDWKVCSELSITGSEYFAVTSSAAMAGGSLNAVWQSGPVSASFLAQADFLMTYVPFHYYLSASVQMGVAVRVSLGFTRVTVRAHLGVGLELWGPPFSGLAHVHLSVVSFTIAFGATRAAVTPTVPWADFVAQLLPATPVRIAASAGLLVELSKTEGELNWLVDGESFRVAVTSGIPIKHHRFTGAAIAAGTIGSYTTGFGVGPAGIAEADFSSTLEIALDGTEESLFLASTTLSNVPTSLWQVRRYDSKGVAQGVDPLKDTTIPGALTGFALVPTPPPPGPAVIVDQQHLLLTVDTDIVAMDWSTPAVQTGDPFTTETVAATIGAEPATVNRSALLAAIGRTGLDVASTVDVAVLSDAAASYLQAQPVLRYLGEAR